MTLGTGIFLASIVGSVTALFIATKDRWNWKRIILWPLALAAVAGAALAAWLAYVDHRGSVRKEATVHNTFWGITLGTSPEDVAFAKGKPTAKDEDSWVYAEQYSDYKHQVGFENGVVTLVVNYGTESYAEELDGHGKYDSLESITATFGEPTHTAIKDEGAQRVLCFDKYQVFFSLRENKVNGYGIYTPGTMQLSCAHTYDIPVQPQDKKPEHGPWDDYKKH